MLAPGASKTDFDSTILPQMKTISITSTSDAQAVQLLGVTQITFWSATSITVPGPITVTTNVPGLVIVEKGLSTPQMKIYYSDPTQLKSGTVQIRIAGLSYPSGPGCQVVSGTTIVTLTIPADPLLKGSTVTTTCTTP